MNDYSNRTIRSEEITIDVRICAALAANRGGEVYFAAIAPDMELTVITLDEAPNILPCFEEDDACLNLPNTSHLHRLRCVMLNFFIGFAFFEAGAIFGFFVAALLNAAHAGQESTIFKENDNGTE